MSEHRKARRLVIWTASAAAHGLALALLARTAPEAIVEPPPILVELVRPIELAPPPEAPAPPKAEPEPTPDPPKPKVEVKVEKPVETPKPPPKQIARLTPNPKPSPVAPLVTREGSTEGDLEAAEVSEAQVASARAAESAGGGAGCNIPGRVQSALRKDPQVRAIVAGVDRGRALKVWDGDWVRHPSQEGKGLAAVREVIMWEVAFAPEACRAEPVHGLVMFKLHEGPGGARLVVGQARWRWTDLLHHSRGG